MTNKNVVINNKLTVSVKLGFSQKATVRNLEITRFCAPGLCCQGK